jgi:hypothetical protein
VFALLLLKVQVHGSDAWSKPPKEFEWSPPHFFWCISYLPSPHSPAELFYWILSRSVEPISTFSFLCTELDKCNLGNSIRYRPVHPWQSFAKAVVRIGNFSVWKLVNNKKQDDDKTTSIHQLIVIQISKKLWVHPNSWHYHSMYVLRPFGFKNVET